MSETTMELVEFNEKEDEIFAEMDTFLFEVEKIFGTNLSDDDFKKIDPLVRNLFKFAYDMGKDATMKKLSEFVNQN